MKKKKSTSYNTGGTYQPVGLPVDPAQIRAQKEQKRKEQGNFWTGLAQFATQYVAPMVAGPLAPAISGAVQGIGMANRSSTTAGPSNYAQDTTQLVPNQELQLNPNQSDPLTFNYGGPATSSIDSLPYMPTISKPLNTMVTPTGAPITTNYADTLHAQLAPLQMPKVKSAVPGVIPMNTIFNLNEGSSGHVKSKDRYREKQYGGSLNYESGGDIQLNESAFQVKGNAQQVDGNTYNMGNQQVALDHNEVVKDNFVFSDSITNPITGNTFSKDALNIEKKVGKVERKIQSYNDIISKKTLKHLDNMSNDLKTVQEAVATAQGHRNEDGSTKQNFATGGPLPWEGFDVKAFQEWYNTIPGGKPLGVDAKWGPTTQAAYKDVAEQYMRTQNKNVIPDQFGGRSNLGPNGYTNVTPVTSPGGKLLSTSAEKYSFPTTGAFSNPLKPLPIVRNGQAGQLVTMPDGTSRLVKGDAYGQPYPANTKFPLPSEMTSLRTAAGFGETGLPIPPSTTPPTTLQDQGYKVPFTAGDALQAVGVGSKFFQALSPVEVEPTYANTAPISQQSYDPRGNLGQNQRNFQNALNSVQAGSLNTRRSIANSILGQRLNADSQVLDKYQQMNVGARTQFEERIGARQRENIGYATYANDLNARNRAARANNLDAAFDSLSYFGAGLNDKRQAQDMINIYRKLFPAIGNNVLSSIN
jgi:hypothetical protein